MKTKTPILLAALLTPALAHAHVIGGTGLSSGLVHPLTGLDHLLAMVAVGILATRYDNLTRWAVPSVFLGAMTIGGILGMLLTVNGTIVETGIALSVVLLGIALFWQKKIPLPLTLGLVGLSALLHGHAHGTEIPLIASPLLYTAGFLAVTGTLHVLGILVGTYMQKNKWSTLFLRYAGASMSALGLLLLIS